MQDCTGADSNCFSIYSLGDASFMRDVFSGVSMIHGSGSLYQAALVALLFGFLVVVIKSMLSGAQRIAIGEIFLSWLMFMLMFVPKVTVVIEDLYSDRAYVVNGVPIGVAFAGHGISTVGYAFAEMMEQSYSSTGYQHGITMEPLLESMYVISKLHDYQTMKTVWENLDVKIGGSTDSLNSWQNYMNDCLMTKYRFDKNSSAVKDSRKSLNTILNGFPSNVYGTVIYRNGATEVSCSEAQNYLMRDFNLLSVADFEGALSTIGISNHSYTSDRDKLDAALSILAESSVEKMNIAKAALLLPIFDRSAAGYYQTSDDVLSSITMEQAISQRNTQWALEQSMFMTTVRPFVTFFESFIYAMTPFSAVLVCIGGFGIRLAIRYLQTLVWLQLWWPILSVINLYIISGASRDLDQQLNNVPMDSFYAIDQSTRIIENWMASAGMLAASTPLIAFFIVSGSAYSFTTLTSRMQGSDHIDESTVAPNLMKQGTLMTSSAGTYLSTSSGRIGSNRETQLAKINIGAEIGRNVSNAKAMVENEQRSLTETVQRAWSRALTSSNSESSSQSYAQMLSKSECRASSMINSTADSIAKQFNLTHEQRDMVASHIGKEYMDSSNNQLGVSAFAAVGSALGVRLGFSHENSSSESESKGRGNSSTIANGSVSVDSEGNTYTLTVSNEDRSALQNSITAQTTDQRSSSIAENLSSSDQSAIAKQFQRVKSAQNTFSQAVTLGHRLSKGFTLDEKEAADAVITSGQSSKIIDAYNDLSTDEKNVAKSEAARLMHLGLDANHARIGGIIYASAESSISENESSSGAIRVMNAVGSSLNINNVQNPTIRE